MGSLYSNNIPLVLGFVGWLCVRTTANERLENGVPNSASRDRSHIDSIIGEEHLQTGSRILQDAIYIYHTMIRPTEELYRFGELHGHTVMSDGIIQARPLVLLLGPWSTGKTTMINYLLGINDTKHMLLTGAEPTTTDFTVMTYGDEFKTIEGLVLTTDSNKQFSSLERFGQLFLEKFQGIEMPSSLLRKVTFVDTPGIIENRKQQERGYPYNSVMKWFMERADLILIVFDPTKLDVGAELESIFKALKGHESKMRIILNKADSITNQELMRVYGALFWNLSPLINVTEPPRVYVGSFWNKAFKDETNNDLFIQEEISLLMDIKQMISNTVENKIASLRKHAKLVRLHAWIVDQFITAYQKKQSLFVDSEEIFQDIVQNPDKHNIYGPILSKHISRYDIPPNDEYKSFFRNNAVNGFRPLSSQCSMFNGCLIDIITDCIERELPRLLKRYSQCRSDTEC